MNNSAISVCLILLLFVFPISKGYAQSDEKIQITGRIIDGETDSPLDYASISVYSLEDTTMLGGGISNEKGDFSIEAKAVPFYLEIKFLGYLSQNSKAFQPEENQKK